MKNRAITLEITYASPQNPADETTLKWEVNSTEASLLWLKLLIKDLESNVPLAPRFSGFHSKYFNMNGLGTILNECIKTINKEGLYKIKESYQNHFDQAFSNVIHHHFEVSGGSADQKSEIWQKGSTQMCKAIAGLNYLIHDMEALDRAYCKNKNRYHDNVVSAIVHTFSTPTRIKMNPAFYKDFALEVHFGDIYLNYAQIGKTWLEVFLDKDDQIFSNAILPLNVISGQFDVFFGNFSFTSDERLEFEEMLKRRGQDPKNPSLALGYLPLAKLMTPHSDQSTFKKNLEEKQMLKKIQINLPHKTISKEYQSYDLKIQYMNEFRLTYADLG